LELGHLGRRPLPEVGQFDGRSLPAREPIHRVPRAPHHVAVLCVRLRTRLVRNVRVPTTGRQAPGFQRASAEEIDREAASVQQDPGVQRPSLRIERRALAPDLEESVLHEVFGVGLVPEQDETEAIDARRVPIVEGRGGPWLPLKEPDHEAGVRFSRHRLATGVVPSARRAICLRSREECHRSDPFRPTCPSFGSASTLGGGDRVANLGIRTLNAP
jgi:hypothetical protein